LLCHDLVELIGVPIIVARLVSANCAFEDVPEVMCERKKDTVYLVHCPEVRCLKSNEMGLNREHGRVADDS
jgi:hypothetical protein